MIIYTMPSVLPAAVIAEGDLMEQCNHFLSCAGPIPTMLSL